MHVCTSNQNRIIVKEREEKIDSICVVAWIYVTTFLVKSFNRAGKDLSLKNMTCACCFCHHAKFSK